MSEVALMAPLRLESVPKMYDIERILGDPDLELKYLESIKSSRSQHHSVHSIILNAIDMASGEYSNEAYLFVVKLWGIVFLKGFLDQPLQRKLIDSIPKVLHLMMNKGDYANYNTLVRPVYTMSHLGAKPSWSDTLISTFQLSRDGDRLRYSKQSILTFLKSDRTMEEKRLLISIFLRKCLLYSDSLKVLPEVLRDFITFLDQIGDGHLLLTFLDLLVYERALRLIVAPQSQTINNRIEAIQNVILDCTGNKDYLSRFISSLLAAVATSDPTTAIELWNYKSERLNTDLLEYREAEDLKNVMKAYYSLRSYDKVIKVHSENSPLHSDDQIEILLKISEQTKDWKLLQKQFEDMYGHNQLPHVIHYSIVMNALASLGVLKEVEQLYHQLLKRNLQPTAETYSALIKANSNTGNKEGAMKWYQVFLKEVEEGKIDQKKVAFLQTKLFEADIMDNDVGSTLSVLRNILDVQKLTKQRFISSELIYKMLTFVSTAYKQKEFEEILEVARQYQLINEQVYYRAISSLTQFSQYEKAEEVAFEAHLESRVPFASATVTRAQLRNYRAWFRSTTNRDIRKFIAERVTNIIKRLDNNTISPRNMDDLLIDIIKHFVSLNKLKTATAYFERVKKLNALSEEHYLPFLQHYSRLDTYDGYAQILEKYREMAKLKISISARTYLYLIKALVHMDKVNHTGFENSYKLLKSVFELYGFSTVDNIAGNNVVLSDLSRNAPTLLKIVSEYSIATSGQADKSMGIMVKFLNQIKEKLGKNIGRDLRMSILHETSKIYLARGDFHVAHQLLNNALTELHETTDKNPGRSPSKLLQIEYRKLSSLKLQVLRHIHGESEAYKNILTNTLQRDIRLSGNQYTEISLELLKNKTDLSYLLHVLEACERYLVSGNWSEIKIRRKIHYIYKLFVVYLSRTLSRETIADKYAALNRYYNAVNLDQVKQEFRYVRDPLAALSREVDSYNRICPAETWTTELLLRNLPQFFVPERRISTKNTISPTLASALFRYIENFCNGDQVKAFELYDQFPETMEYLLYYGEERTRMVSFQREIDELNPPSKSAHTEDQQSRRERALEALDHLRITTTDIDSV